jgi:ADP-heptose:LPS heptosyltransferase
MDFLLDCLKEENFIQFEKDKLKPELLLTKNEFSFATDWLEEHCGQDFETKNLLAVAPASKWQSKVWAEDNFSQVVSELIFKKNVFPVIFGGTEDRGKGNRLIKKWGIGANAAGELNIRQAAAALSFCRLYLGNDTGTMHLAASVGTTCVAVFAALDWAGRWIPFGDKHKIFRETVPCEGCLLSVCPFENKCLKLINVENVLRACLIVLNEKGN